MRTRYAATLTEGERVGDTFSLRSKELRSSRAGEAYLTLEFADKTGRIAGVMFRPDRSAQAIPVGSVVWVDGSVTTYRGVTRVSVQRLRLAGSWDVADLLPSSSRDPQELVRRLRELARTVKDPSLAALLRVIFKDRDFMSRFRRCPGAQSHHHACIGGLLEHSVAVAELCHGMSSLYPEVDHDLLVTGALIHDMGKVDELRFDTAIEYTDEGRLIGHVVLGERRLRRAADAVPGVGEGMIARLSHLMLSHHGELEWGSPKRPCTLEALILHHADNMDAKTAGFIETTANAARVEEQWTDAANLFRRPLYAPCPVEDDRWCPPSEEDVYMRRHA